MIIYQRMKLRNDIYFFNVMYPAMFALQAGFEIVSVSKTFFSLV